MIKEFKIVRVDCDCCGAFYPSKTDPIHFQNEEDANKTVFDEGWKIMTHNGELSHYCPSCQKVCRDSGIVIEEAFATMKSKADGS